jgi:hypothetical protein
MESNGKRKRKKHTEEFKREAVRLLESRGERTIADVAASLGVAENLLHAWKRKLGSVVMLVLLGFARRASAQFSPGASLNQARAAHTATLLPNGQVLVVGGGSFGGALSSTELYNLITNTWSFGASLTVARDLHTATLLANGKVLVTGGLDASGNATSTAEVYDRPLRPSSAQPESPRDKRRMRDDRQRWRCDL